ncbi:MAG: hypothetical protein KAG28_07565 [Cocleimonas sp.]|nr:hypothetical protein [Cocleimonas sp.]
MKPQTLLGLVATATALYSLSGCSQYIPQTEQAKKVVSHHVAYRQTATPRPNRAVLKQRLAKKRRSVARRKTTPPRRYTKPKIPRYTPPKPRYRTPQVQRPVAAPSRPPQQRRPIIQPRYRPQPMMRPTPRFIAPRRPRPQMQRSAPTGMSRLSPQEIRRIGDQIFANESGSDIKKLVHWNIGEDFASMGIGHFTWYPNRRHARFGNTFPGLLNYLESRGVRLPQWLQSAKQTGAPWRSREQLHRDRNAPQVRQLQRILYETRYLQAEYIMQRAQRAMPKLVKATPPHLRPLVANNLNAIANSKGGWYPLIDYVNFKGEGLNRHGGYRGKNWGLLQVLEEMRPVGSGQGALNEFASAAMRVLDRRVKNSPPARKERRWLAGWSNRVDTYRHES